MTTTSPTRAWFVAFVLIWLGPVAAGAAEVRVMSSAGFKAAYLALASGFERETGHRLVNAWGPSMGETPQAVPNRIARGEPVDVVIGVREALVALAKDGKLVAASRADLARSLIGAAVRSGAAKPDMSSLEGFKRALAEAGSIAYSDSASGVYIETQLYPRLGVSDAIKAKSRRVPAEPVGEVVARGDAALGFQQMSELKPVRGIDLVGPIPPEVQKVTVFSAILATGAKEAEAGRALIAYLVSPRAADTIRASGMEPGGSE